MGENRPQSLWQKSAELPLDIAWHMIGHLQTNKIRRTLPIASLIHSVDSVRLAESISHEAQRLDRIIPVALEVNLTGETAKQGFPASQIADSLPSLLALPNLRIAGLMTMARLCDEAEQCRPVFAELRQLRDALRSPTSELPVLSMGMSQDFEVAIEEGATHVRVGSALFEGVADDGA